MHTALVAALNSGSSTKEAFATACGVDYRSVETGLKEYVRQARFGYHEYELALQADESIDMQDVPRAELLAALGTYLVDAAPWQTEYTDEHLLESLALLPAQPRLHAALGDVYARQGRTVEAQQQFEQAIRYGADDAETQARYGHHLVDQYVAAGGEIPLSPTVLPEPLAEARQMLNRAVQLNPGDGEAFASLGKTYLFDPQDTLVGLQTLSVARSLLPGRMDVAYYQVLLLMRIGDRASAEALTNQVLVHATDRELYELAQAALENAAKGQSIEQFNEAVDQFNMGKYARALEILEALVSTLNDADLREAAEELVAKAHAAQSEQADIDRLNAQIVRYNTAVDKAEAGDLAGAQAILEALVNEVDDADLARSSRDLLQRVRSALASRTKRP